MSTDTAVAERATSTAVATTQRVSLVAKMAERFSVEPTKLLDTLKATAFKAQGGVTNEQMMSLLIVADQYKLNPFTKELFAFPDKGGIVPVVSVDGWARIINERQELDGIAFHYDEAEQAMTCTIYRKDRGHPTVVTEYLAECKRGTQPWNSHPRRMLRHKALIQCARVAFGFAGLYDQDEAERIVKDMGPADEVGPAAGAKATAQQLNGLLASRKPAGEVIDAESTEKVVGADPATFIAQVEAATSAEAAQLVLDDARDALDGDGAERLFAAYEAKWGTGS